MPIEPGNISLGVIAGGLIGVLAGHYHYLAGSRSVKDRKISDFNKAAVEFRCAFTDELRLIADSTQDTDFEKIFNAAYARHYNALIRFLPYLSKSERTEIEKAWKEHCKEHDNGSVTSPYNETTSFMHYKHKQGIEHRDGKFHIIEEHEVPFQRAKSLANKNIEKILSFTMFK